MQAFGLGIDSVTTAYAGATEHAYDMIPGRQYRLVCTTNAWIKNVVAGGGGATIGGAGCIPVQAFTEINITAASKSLTRINVIQDAAPGKITITERVQSVG